MSEDDMFYCSFVSIHYIICECGETFPTEEALKVHLEKEHPHKKERKEYKCGVCEAIFPTEQQCIQHYEAAHIEIKHEHDYIETENSQSPQSQSEEQEVYTYYEEGDYGEITKEAVTTVICEVCGQLYPEDTTHKCPTDNDSQDDEMSMKPIIKNKKGQNDPSKKVCEVCGKKYASNAALRYHQRVHTGERPYKCSMCNKTFTMPLFLQIHVRTHTGERPYECTYPHCLKAFSNKAALLRHDRVHTGVKPYKCPQCGKFFTQSNSMKLHVHTVHLKMPAPYKSRSRRSKAIKREDATAVENMVSEHLASQVSDSLSEAEMHLVKEETEYQEDVMYEDVDREVTYEIVYED